jgi:signal transduction histidine kinase
MEQRENLREMAERVVIAQEEERKRISRDLHDDLGQVLTTQLFELRKLQEEVTSPGKMLFARLQMLHDQTNETFQTIHRLAQDLRPPALDALGLKLALKNYCAEFTRRFQIPVTFEFDQEIYALPDIYNITLYRTLQEALTNIVKHAQASQVWVEINLDEDHIMLTIQDNGQGFDPSQAQSNGLGLSGLRERLTLVGGSLQISSNPVRGTILSARLPMSEEYATRETA